MENSKFLGICLLISSVILSIAIVFRSKSGAPPPPPPQIGRYQFHTSTPPGVIWVIDTITGDVKSHPG
jgi:hypothetical protein